MKTNLLFVYVKKKKCFELILCGVCRTILRLKVWYDVNVRRINQL